MTMNCVPAASPRGARAKRVTLASSSAASTSSRTQKGTGRTSRIAKRSATAVKARSPPESIARAWRFLPGGRAMISTPVCVSASGSVSSRLASPPSKSCAKRRAKAPPRGPNAGRDRPPAAVGGAGGEGRGEAPREGALGAHERGLELLRDALGELGDEQTRAADGRQQVVLLRFQVGQSIAHRRMLLGRERGAGAQLVVTAGPGRLGGPGRGGPPRARRAPP